MAKASMWRALREVAANRSKLTADPRIELQKIKPKAFDTDGSNASTDYAASPYDFTEIDNLFDTDSYAQQALDRKVQTFFKEGYDIKGADPDAVAYIKTRCKLLAIAMNQSFDDFVCELAENIIKYHNVFLITTRDMRPQQLTGLPYQGIGSGDPIAGYTVAAVGTMSIKRDTNGKILGYKQVAGQSQGEFKPIEVIHGTYSRKTGTVWGKPNTVQAIEDFISFRIIEGDALNLVHKEMYPNYVYYVGDERRPAEQKDLDEAAQRLMDMREVGGLVAPGKDKVETIGSNKVLDTQPHVSHFKERAIVGLGVSPYQIGVTSDINKSTAERLDAQFYTQLKHYQNKIANLITDRIFFEMLLEGGFDPIGINGDSQNVRLEFREIDVDALIKRQNHVGVLWVQNQIKHGEMREELGYEVDPETADLYHYQMVELELAKAKATAGGENPNSPAKGAGPSKNNPANGKGNRGGPKMTKAYLEPTDTDRLVEYADVLERKLGRLRKKS